MDFKVTHRIDLVNTLQTNYRVSTETLTSSLVAAFSQWKRTSPNSGARI
jgi:hypothetical protein